MSRCYDCCQGNCGYRYCSCPCHADDRVEALPKQITVRFLPGQFAGLREAFRDRMPFSIEHEGVLYHDMVIVEMRSEGVMVLQEAVVR